MATTIYNYITPNKTGGITVNIRGETLSQQETGLVLVLPYFLERMMGKEKYLSLKGKSPNWQQTIESLAIAIAVEATENGRGHLIKPMTSLMAGAPPIKYGEAAVNDAVGETFDAGTIHYLLQNIRFTNTAPVRYSPSAQAAKHIVGAFWARIIDRFGARDIGPTNPDGSPQGNSAIGRRG